MVPQEAAQPPLEILMLGKKDFKGEKLHMLQIGLGNFGTFVQYLANPSEAPAYNAGIDWLLYATSNDFDNRTFLGVGVEPVVEHLKELEGLAGSDTILNSFLR